MTCSTYFDGEGESDGAVMMRTLAGRFNDICMTIGDYLQFYTPTLVQDRHI